MKIARLTLAAALALAGNAHSQTLIGGGKSLTFPIHITQPGSYRLAGNLSVPAGVNGIEIAAPNVTLDLNGFSVVGPSVCTGEVAWDIACQQGVTTHGIRSNEQATVVRNGSVQGFNTGVAIGGGIGVRAGRIENMVALRNTLVGFSLAGGTGVNLHASYNGVAGLAGVESMFIDSTASYNKSSGFDLGDSVVRGARTFGNNFGVSVRYGKVGIESSFIQAVTAPFFGAVSSMGSNLCGGAPC